MIKTFKTDHVTSYNAEFRRFCTCSNELYNILVSNLPAKKRKNRGIHNQTSKITENPNGKDLIGLEHELVSKVFKNST